MAETISTGGVKQFVRPRGYSPKLEKEQEYEIEEAYNRYYKRRKKEKKMRIWVLVLIVILILIGLGVWWATRN